MTALQAFSLAIAPLPGVRVPAGPVGVIPDGSLAVGWLLPWIERLTRAQRAVVEHGLALNPVATRASRTPVAMTAQAISDLYQ